MKWGNMHERGLGFYKFLLEGGVYPIINVFYLLPLYPIINIFNLLQIFVKGFKKMGLWTTNSESKEKKVSICLIHLNHWLVITRNVLP